MASATLKVPVKRSGTPVITTTHSKIVSLEEWESKTALTEAELRSIANVQKACEDRPLPLKTSIEDNAAALPSTPIGVRVGLQTNHSRPATPVLGSKQQAQEFHPLHPKHPIQSAQQFYDWYSAIERRVAHSQESHFREHLAGVEGHLETCDGLGLKVDKVQSEVDSMLEGWRSVEVGGRNLKDACQQLLGERDRLIRLSEEIGARLDYFQELDYATRMLNHPGESLVLQADFLDMVERVDICLDFLRAHRHYYEAETYLLRFQQCLTRAMTLVKMYFVASLKALTADISKRISDKDISQTTQMHLFYTRFQSIATQVAPLLGELERRTRAHPDDLTSLLSECHSAYFSSRRTLLVGRLVEEIRGLDPNRADLVELTSSGCGYLKQLCIDEFSIYRSFFDSGKDQLYQYLEGLCDYLYDDLRPRILHEPRLSVLCDVCKVLQALMVLDVPETEAGSDDEDDAPGNHGLSSTDLGTRQGLGRLHISHMLQSVLQDAQTRLFFKAQTVVQSEIRYYVPKAEDLDYPGTLEESSRQPEPLELKEREGSPLFQLSSFKKRETWFPTLKTTIAVLTQLRDFIQPSIFNDIAQEAIDLCRMSLVSASNLLATKDPPPTETDVQLFIIRHMLVLKELTNGIGLTASGSDGPLELRHVTDTLRDMLRTNNMMPYAFATSLTKLRDEASASSTKEGIDAELRRACERVINACSQAATQPIHSFMSSLTVEQNGTVVKIGEPIQRTELSRDAAIDADESFRRCLEKEAPEALARLRLYLDDSGTISVLLSHIQDKIIDEYVTFRKATEFMPAMNDRSFSSPDGIRTYIRTLS